MIPETIIREGAKDNVLAHDLDEESIPKGYYIDPQISTWAGFKQRRTNCLDSIRATDNQLQKRSWKGKLLPDIGKDIFPFENALRRVRNMAEEVHASGGKVVFVGNGGSAAIASHMAVDWTKNGGIRSMALNDAPTLTCLANDFGYEEVFAKQLEYYCAESDLVVVVSTSGKSANILAAGRWCLDHGRKLVTLSGMRHLNQLRFMGLVNFYVPAMDYGLVELTHADILHSIVTIQWPREE